MFFKNHHIHKAISVALVAILLFIHSIKLLHTHSYLQFDATTAFNKTAPEKKHHFINKIADCNICAYQVSKDADDSFFPVYKVGSTGIYKPAIPSCSDELISFFSASESRGPPSLG